MLGVDGLLPRVFERFGTLERVCPERWLLLALFVASRGVGAWSYCYK